MTRRATFTEAELTRAIRAAQKCGLPVVTSEICPDGRIVIHHESAPPPAADPLEAWLAKNGHRDERSA
jgi:hypothetical protein